MISDISTYISAHIRFHTIFYRINLPPIIPPSLALLHKAFQIDGYMAMENTTDNLINLLRLKKTQNLNV